MPIFTDGEMRRDAWQTNFSEAVDGFEDTYPIREVERRRRHARQAADAHQGDQRQV